MSGERVTLVVRNGIADVRLARPEKMNALDPAMFDALSAMIARLATEPGLRVVVLSGEGKAFCAGLDMASLQGGLEAVDIHARSHGLANRFQDVAWGWRTLPVPVIAAVHGIAFGGGLQILAGADIRIAQGGTRFSVMESKWGLVPDMAGMALWRGTVRDDILRACVYTAREFQADEAESSGFVTRVSAEAVNDAFALARQIAERSPHAIRGAKRLLNAMADDDASTLLAKESEEQAKLLFKPNQQEAVQAILENRPPRYPEE